MPRVAVDDNERMNLRIRRDQKAMLLRAAALRNTDLTDFVLQYALREAEAVIQEADVQGISTRSAGERSSTWGQPWRRSRGGVVVHDRAGGTGCFRAHVRGQLQRAEYGGRHEERRQCCYVHDSSVHGGTLHKASSL